MSLNDCTRCIQNVLDVSAHVLASLGGLGSQAQSGFGILLPESCLPEILARGKPPYYGVVVRDGPMAFLKTTEASNAKGVRPAVHQDRFSLIAAVHVFLRRDDQVLLLRRHNTGYMDGCYSVVAGHLEGNEEVGAAAVREAEEEAGIHIQREDVKIVGVMHRRSSDERVDFFVECSCWAGDVVNREPDKCDDLSWFALDRLPENTIPYVRRALENCRQGRWFDSYGW